MIRHVCLFEHDARGELCDSLEINNGATLTMGEVREIGGNRDILFLSSLKKQSLPWWRRSRGREWQVAMGS